MSTEKAILCIDDERIILDSLKTQISREFNGEFTIEVAESADEGMEVIEEMVEDGVRVLIIVSDWLMPGMKGDEFLIGVHQRFPEIVKVMLTGQAEEQALERAFNEANLYKVIKKPWEKEELIGVIKSGLEITS
ncbi:response regulator [Marinoscillum pacificum]|uniref:response regulator n=1 Tax=Marinoscillum pacificum TaxID=392723 RepID=UPI002156F8FF|nr:response regulator [Marinoscillum pacificum]